MLCVKVELTKRNIQKQIGAYFLHEMQFSRRSGYINLKRPLFSEVLRRNFIIIRKSYLQKISVTLLFHLPRPGPSQRVPHKKSMKVSPFPNEINSDRGNIHTNIPDSNLQLSRLFFYLRFNPPFAKNFFPPVQIIKPWNWINILYVLRRFS